MKFVSILEFDSSLDSSRSNYFLIIDENSVLDDANISHLFGNQGFI